MGCEGLNRSPPSAQAMASSTLVLPCSFRPPMTVRPLAAGSTVTARIRLTFSISSRLIFTIGGLLSYEVGDDEYGIRLEQTADR